MALFSIEGVFTWGHFLTLKKKSTPNFILRLVPLVDKAPLPLRILVWFPPLDADKLLKGENQSTTHLT